MEEIKEKAAIPDEKFYNMMIAITEAVNNAIVHGNKLDKEKCVDFAVEVCDRTLWVVVNDCGRGFDHENIADPRDPENLLKEGGRGVFIIKSLAEEVEFSTTEKGTELKMKFTF
jgi:serine/threonine-protein kinase RsbW